MELDEIRDGVLLATLPHVAFEGWTVRAMRAGEADSGLSEADAGLAFAGGATERIEHWSAWSDRQMLDGLQGLPLESMRLREKIAGALRLRIEANTPYREAVRRTLSFLAIPPNPPVAARCIYRTVDAAWYACGDQSTNVSFYSKRATLAAVLGATVLYWLDDTSDEFIDSWAFLDRRLDDILRVPRLQQRGTEMLEAMMRPWRGLRPRSATETPRSPAP